MSDRIPPAMTDEQFEEAVRARIHELLSPYLGKPMTPDFISDIAALLENDAQLADLRTQLLKDDR